MKVLALQGSPRKKGSTSKILGWVQEELESLNHEVTTSFLQSKTIKGCMACGKCKDFPDEIGCIQKDDAPELLQAMIVSDLVIFASPLYFWGVTAQIKALIDRTFSLYIDYKQPTHKSLIENKKHAFLITGGSGYDDNAESTFTSLGRLQKPHKTVHAGELFIGGCKNPDDVGEDVKQQAVEFARKIAAT